MQQVLLDMHAVYLAYVVTKALLAVAYVLLAGAIAAGQQRFETRILHAIAGCYLALCITESFLLIENPAHMLPGELAAVEWQL